MSFSGQQLPGGSHGGGGGSGKHLVPSICVGVELMEDTLPPPVPAPDYISWVNSRLDPIFVHFRDPIFDPKKEMKQKADDLFFEDAMKYRDKIKKLEKTLLIMA